MEGTDPFISQVISAITLILKLRILIWSGVNNNGARGSQNAASDQQIRLVAEPVKIAFICMREL